ncbi:MAG: HNH endonuclease, partial [Candidatus Krumholzibacteriia bacterium]
EAARQPRRELAAQVKRAKRAALVDPGQGELLPSEPTVVAPTELPVRLTIELTPEQEARRAALVERLHKLGGAPADRAELLLEALAALVEAKQEEKMDPQKAPRGAHPSGPPVHIHVHEDKDGALTIPTDAGPRPVGRADTDRLRCDAVLVRPGRRNAATIAPRVRREVMARDRHRCQTPGCGRTRFLEVHHVVPRERGGTNASANLVTLCATCHRFWHERGAGAVADLAGG